MSTYVNLQHERTGELKSVKVGWSWTLFLFSQAWGIPLFFRRMFDWAAVCFILSAVNFWLLMIADTDPAARDISGILGVGSIGISVFLALRGNELTAKRMLREGWTFSNPDDVVTHHAKRVWSLR